jgi:Animal haem peroxidase
VQRKDARSSPVTYIVCFDAHDPCYPRPLYNDLRAAAGLPRKASFADITFDTELQTQLAAVYDSVDDIEAFAGALSENHVIGANVGELLGTVMKIQFENLMHGDPFFWLGDTDLQDAGLKDVIDMSKITLAKIIDFNTVLERDPALSAFVRGKFDEEGTRPFPLTANRTIDGSDRSDGKGAAETALMRLSNKTTYTPESPTLNGTMMVGVNPRLVSNDCFSQTASKLNNRNLLDMVWQWGQVRGCCYRWTYWLAIQTHVALLHHSSSTTTLDWLRVRVVSSGNQVVVQLLHLTKLSLSPSCDSLTKQLPLDLDS